MSSEELPNLPLEICREILLRSPAVSVFRFRSVCSGWCKVIDDPTFSHTFVSLSSSHTLLLKNSVGPPLDPLHAIDIDTLDFFTGGHQLVSTSSHDLDKYESRSLLARLPVPACNGLILVHPKNLEEGPLEIWNPSTHEVLQLPRLCFCHRSCKVLFGLGYDYPAQDFKAVVVDCQQTRVYSLRSDTWRKIGGCPGCVDESWPEEHVAVFVHGVLHWMLGDRSLIFALDIATEKHRHIQLNSLPNYKGKRKDMDVLGGCLAVSGFSVSCFDVWVMKDYGSDDESWEKLLSVRRIDLITFGIKDLRPVAYVRDKKQVFLKDRHGSAGFFVFDLESDCMKSGVRIEGLTGDSYAQNIPRTMFRLCDNCGAPSGTTRLLSLEPPQKRKLSFAITTYPAPLKKHKK